MSNGLTRRELEPTFKAVYRKVTTAPDEVYPFEVGRELAKRLGYSPVELGRIPSEATDSFAGVGYHVDLARIAKDDDVLDLGSGSGMDAFAAALHAGPTGHVTGIDMSVEGVRKAGHLRDRNGFDTVAFEHGSIEDLSFETDAFDVVLPNGTITLSTRKERAFHEASRVLRPYGRLTVSDIVSEKELPDRITTDTDCWAAYIGGAMHTTAYVEAIEAAGLEVIVLYENPQYEFRTDQARSVGCEYGVKSVSFTARKR